MSSSQLRLLDLPPELLIAICSSLDLPSLARFRRVSSTVHSLVKSASELLFRRLCFTAGLTDEATASSSTAVGSAPSFGLKSLAEQFDEHELQLAVEAQRGMSGLYDGVETWEDFAYRRVLLDKRWSGNLDCFEHWVLLDREATAALHANGGALWRFKLDPEGGLILATGIGGGVFAFDIWGKLVWETALPRLRYGHIEASNGHFVTLVQESSYLVWRRADITSPPAPISPNVFESVLETVMTTADGVSYTPFDSFTSPSRINATKLRFPAYLGASTADRRLLLMNLENKTIAGIDISRLWGDLDDPDISYVELSGSYCFVAGEKSVSIWHPTQGYVGLFPPEGQGGHWRRSEVEPGYSAVHHDLGPQSRGRGNLVASTSGVNIGPFRGYAGLHQKLIWSCRMDRILSGGRADDIAESTVVLSTFAPVIQLSVENGRCAFVLQEGSMSSLWLVNLKPFNSIEEFEKDPPEVHCIAYPIPSLYLVARLEMLSDMIVVPASSVLQQDNPLRADFDALSARLQDLRDKAMQGDVAEDLNPSFRWETLGGRVLKTYRGLHAENDVHDMWVDQIVQPAIDAGLDMDGTDAFVSYSFGGPPQ